MHKLRVEELLVSAVMAMYERSLEWSTAVVKFLSFFG